MGRNRTVRALLAAAFTLVAATACMPNTTVSDPVVEVTGDFGRRPQVAFTTPLKIPAPSSRVLIEGEGTVLDEGSPVLLSYVAYSATTGRVVDSSYGHEPLNFNLKPEHGPLYEELLGKREGTRFLQLSQGTEQRQQPVVLVYDVLHTRAWGEVLDAATENGSLPRVTRAEDGRPSVEIPDADPPLQLRVVTLIKGHGPQVQEGDLLTAHYSSVAWEEESEFDSTWGEDRLSPPAISFAGLIPAWQTGLAGATVGSQIMIIAPPADAFGSDTVVFIIDLLATTTPESNSND